eukprot:TRINITY_DN32700_c0_g1_i1.p3 TRINITY_DN32700_c0_g1~~TRINITY_DN32700_c0_g1_i1.p3  ORF type:complete len:102 (+),score=12.34 TRINITY_DN32700_c0_g1_i1:1063-1368(+)
MPRIPALFELTSFSAAEEKAFVMERLTDHETMWQRGPYIRLIEYPNFLLLIVEVAWRLKENGFSHCDLSLKNVMLKKDLSMEKDVHRLLVFFNSESSFFIY